VILCHQCGAPNDESDRFCRSCGVAATSGAVGKDPLISRTIGGSYVMLELVGVGGMGRVYRAEQRMLGRTVAIKVIHPHLLSDEQSVARFYTEARAASRLNHPNSVSIIDFGRTDDGILYLVMEYLEGKDLARLMREDGPLPIARICEILASVLDALAEAHALGVVHRDLKPENVIIERLKAGRDLVKVVDFGLAKLLSGTQGRPSITLPGLVCGTPDYMSPEQGRGEETDARGDIYSVGVMLFELLTERLPFLADTPTNVVLMHIQDPVPDPRSVAPERQIPEALVQVLMRGLSKSLQHRFQRAEEMASALRRIAAQLSPTGFEVVCPSCSARSPMNKRFCAECGSPLQRNPSPMPRASLPPRMTIARSQNPILVGRDRELELTEALREAAYGRFVAAVVTGEPGVGRSRFLAEVAERASVDGDLVLGAGPHDSGAPVAYHPIRMLVQGLLDGDNAAIASIAERESSARPLVAAGLRELIQPTGVLGAPHVSKVGAVACALAFAVNHAQARGHGKRIVLLVDDLHGCDGLSPSVLCELPRYTGAASLFLISVGNGTRALPMPDGTHTIKLRGFSTSQANAFISGVRLPEDGSESSERQLVPLYLEQLQALGLQADGSGRALPPRLADVVATRIQRLNVAARRLLQAIAVLGLRAAQSSVEQVVEPEYLASLPQLLARGFVVESGGTLEIIHPLVRDLVEASTPAEVRRALHMRALSVATRVNAPLEVRAHHAYGSGETLSALVMLERLGDLSASRGDLETAVLGFQRGIDLARREVLESGDTSLDDIIASLGRRLGSVLARRGDYAGAEGVLREALEHSSSDGPRRAPILIALASAVAQRSREREAARLLGQALEIAYRDDAISLQAEVQLALAALRRRENNVKSAVSALQALAALLSEHGGDAVRCAHVYLELCDAQLAENDIRGAETSLARLSPLLDAADLPHLRARGCAMRAKMYAQKGDPKRAVEVLREAVELAARAGAADFVAALEDQAREFSEGPGYKKADPARNAASN
jgi:eukaryotic-like serine/threonine-protein kinase